MFTVNDVMQYEPISNDITWAELKATSLYKIYLRHAGSKPLAELKSNVDSVMRGNIPQKLIKAYGFTQHDQYAPYKLYQYIRVMLKRLGTPT